MEIGVWGPSVEVGARGPVDAQFKSDARSEGKNGGHLEGNGDGPYSELTPSEQAWAHWLDDTRGGRGFLNWQPTAIPGLRTGGFERDTIVNPPVDVLPKALHGLAAFVLKIAENLPRLEVEVLVNRPLGKLHEVRARVRNRGLLPSGVGPGAQSSTVRLRLELTPGVNRNAGPPEAAVGHLPGLGTSGEYGWLMTAPEGALVNIVVESAWSAPATREVRL
jgi:hypothetical protein